MEEMYDISFIRRNLTKLNITRADLSVILHVSLNMVNDLLEGNIKISNSKLEPLYRKYKVSNYDSLKYKIENYERFKNFKLFKDQNETIDNKYSFEFMKEYVFLYDVEKETLAQMFHCGLSKVEDVINGNILFKQSLVDDICYENGYTSYDKFKQDIENRIRIRKNNIANKPVEKKKNVFNLDGMDKKELFELMDLKNMEYKEALVSLLLFSGVVNKTPEELAELLSMSETYILMIFKNDICKVRQSLKDKYFNATLVYDDKTK